MSVLPDVSAATAYGVATYPPGATFGPRRMRDFEFVWVVEGDAVYERDGAAFAADAGSIVLCRPGGVDSFIWDTKRPTHHTYAHFDVRAVPSHWPEQDMWPLVRPQSGEDIIPPLLRHLLATGGQSPEHQRLTLAHMLSSFVLGRTSLQPIVRPIRSEPVERALRHIYRALDSAPESAVTLGELAGIACVTREHLCRLFTAEIGHSPLRVVHLARLDRAAVLICRSNYALAEVAAMCGFSDGFHLSRSFSRAFGKSPLAVRSGIRAGTTPPLPRLLDQHT